MAEKTLVEYLAEAGIKQAPPGHPVYETRIGRLRSNEPPRSAPPNPEAAPPQAPDRADQGLPTL
jgi:hypothetical protein